MNIAIIGSGVGAFITVRVLKKDTQSVYLENTYGGKLGSLKLNKFSFDTGPSLLTIPHLIDELFSMHGEDPYSILIIKERYPL